jgi:hypothetical protein
MLIFSIYWAYSGNPLGDLRKVPLLEPTPLGDLLGVLVVLMAGSWATVVWGLAPAMAPVDPRARLPVSPPVAQPFTPAERGASPMGSYLLPGGNGAWAVLLILLFAAVAWPTASFTAGPPPAGTPAVRFDANGKLEQSSRRQVATGTFVPDCRGTYLRSQEKDPPTLDALSDKCAGTWVGAKPTFIAAIAKANPDQRFVTATPGVVSATFRYGQVVVVPTMIPTPTARPTATSTRAPSGYACTAPPDKDGYPTYTVVDRDTLMGIVTKCRGDLTVEKIKDLNPRYKDDPDTVKQGELVKLPRLGSATNSAPRTTSFASSGTFTLQDDQTPQEASGTFHVLLGTSAKEVASATFAPGKAPALSANLKVQVGPYATATFEWKPGDGGLAGELVYGVSDGEPENAKSLVGATVPSGDWTVWVRSTGADGNTAFAKVGILDFEAPRTPAPTSNSTAIKTTPAAQPTATAKT